MAPTHTDIAQRMRAIEGNPSPAAEKERASLRELCAGLGHAFAHQWPYCLAGHPRVCTGCGTKEGG
jgi:hypothetical protein